MDDYVIIKTPIRALKMKLEKSSTLDQLAQAASKPSAPRLDAQMSDHIAGRFESTVGTRLELEGTIGYAGRDQDCVYMAGRLSTTEKPDEKLWVAGCMTVAHGKFLTVYRYDSHDSVRIEDLKLHVRSIAKTIR